MNGRRKTTGRKFPSKRPGMGFKRGVSPEIKGKCRFCAEKVTEIDYKDTNKLKRCITEKGKIMHSRATGTCASHQRQLANAVKRARFVALLSYVGE